MMQILKWTKNQLVGLPMRIKVLGAFGLISTVCVFTVLGVTSVGSSQALESLAISKLEAMGQVMKQRMEDYSNKSDSFANRLSKNRLIEGLFLSYESAFYGGGFIPGEDQKIDTAAYQKLNSTYGSRVTSLAENFGFANIILATVDSQVVFSSKPDPAGNLLGRNILDGAHAKTQLAACYTKALDAPAGKIIFSGYELNPVVGSTIAFLCTKQEAEFDHLSEGIKIGDVMGIIVAEIDLATISNIVTQRLGMGETGQAYLVGPDKILRSDFFLEKEKFNVDLAFKNKSIIDTKSVTLALKGESGNHQITDPTGNDVLSFYTSLNAFGEKWAIVAEQRIEEVNAPVYQMLVAAIIAASILMGVIFIFSIFMTKAILSPVIDASGSLELISRNVSSHADSMNNNALTLSSGSSEITDEIKSTLDVLEDLKYKLDVTLTNVNSSTETGTRSLEAAKRGSEAVKNMTHAMENINHSNDETIKVMNDISGEMSEIIKEIQNIAEKTHLIDDIVFQTKLLSFNASVEAARAGNDGKGFAVVAEEVGNLAAASGQAAREMADMLNGSLQKVESIVDETSKKIVSISKTGQETVERGVETAQQCGSALDEILDNITEVNEKIMEISRASGEQAEGINNVNTGMNKLDKITSQTANIAQETQEGSISLTQGASELNDVVFKLNHLVHGARENLALNTETEKSAETAPTQDNISPFPQAENFGEDDDDEAFDLPKSG